MAYVSYMVLICLSSLQESLLELSMSLDEIVHPVLAHLTLSTQHFRWLQSYSLKTQARQRPADLKH